MPKYVNRGKRQFSEREKRAYSAGRGYAAAKKGKRIKCNTEKEKQSFRNGVISKTEALSADFDGSAIPENAETAKIVITPTADEDGKVDLTEVLGYAGQVTVTVNR